jgi:uncharacterized protein (TIGR03435 family)
VRIGLIGWIAIGCGAGFGQTSAALPAFEVASVKPHAGPRSGEGARRDRVTVEPGRLTMINVTLRRSIQSAYEVQEYQVSGPGWLDEDRYDISAKSADAVPEKELHLMLQRLLAERFKLEFHRVKKELPVYTLLVAKNGPKFHESTADGEFSVKPTSRTTASIQRATMAQLVDVLTRVLKSPVLDETGLQSRYDVDIDITSYIPEGFEHSNGPPPDLAAIAMAAVQEQLGLKLESRKAMVDMLVVDRAEKAPTEN